MAMQHDEMMSIAPDTHERQAPAGEARRRRTLLGYIYWFLGLATLIIMALIVRSHPTPWSFELSFSRTIQTWQPPVWVIGAIHAITTLNDPIPSGFAVVVLVAFLLFKRWLRPALFLGYLILVGNSIDALIGDSVGRPRPNPHLIHVTATLTFNSFPSGHTEHDVIFYGFLLFLTLTRKVRQWKYARWLLPVQILMVFDILIIGFARVLEGEHWLMDVVGGYLSGALWLTLFIYLYGCQWTRNEPGAWQEEEARAA